uniref:Uncharacterized protein n=1 Tax=Lactuca sativa TaxID=4236 RepID=A0A9R1X4L5_LACSA|nr:hypothetical protein LSAT_V11C700371650 [Lactuca sativa]
MEGMQINTRKEKVRKQRGIEGNTDHPLWSSRPPSSSTSISPPQLFLNLKGWSLPRDLQERRREEERRRDLIGRPPPSSPTRTATTTRQWDSVHEREYTLSDFADYLKQVLEDVASVREEVKQLKVMIQILILLSKTFPGCLIYGVCHAITPSSSLRYRKYLKPKLKTVSTKLSEFPTLPHIMHSHVLNILGHAR